MAGCRVVTAATSQEALALAQRRSFDVVTSDLSRCGMNGLEFLKVFKQAHPTVPVIIVSAVLNDATARRARRLRAFECLPKPFQLRELVALVREAITSRKVCRTVLWPRRRKRFASEL
jgi:two-component system, NtrC family, nitrogen regulation response regulator GlnG